MAKLFRIHSALTLDTRKFTTSLKGASDRVTRFARNMEKTTARIGRSFKRAGKDLLFIGAAPAAALILSVKNYAAMADEIGKLAKQTGIATTALTEYQHVAELTGITFEKWVDAIRFMQDAISSTIGDAPLKRLGLDKESLKQLAPEEAFEKIVKALGDVDLAADRTGLSLDLFGRSGSIILRLVGADFKALREEARKLGLSFSEENAAAAEQFNDDLSRLKRTAQGFSFLVAKTLLPDLNNLVVTMTKAGAAVKAWVSDNNEASKSFSSMLKGTALLTTAIIGAGGLLFAVGQVAFALNSLIKLQKTFSTLSLVSVFAGAAAVILPAAAALLIFNKEARDFVRQIGFIERATDKAFANASRKGRSVRDYFINVADLLITGPSPVPGSPSYEAYRERLKKREIERLNQNFATDQATYGRIEQDQKKISLAEALLTVGEESLKIQRETQAGRDALGGSKMQPGGIL